MNKKKKELDEVKTEQTISEVKDDEIAKEEAGGNPDEAPKKPDGADEASNSANEKGDRDAADTDSTEEANSDEALTRPETVKVLFSPKSDHPGMLASRQVQPGEMHEVSQGAWQEVKGNKDYRLVK